MDYDEQTTNRYSTTIRFVAIAVVLGLLLLLGIFVSKKAISNLNGENASKTATTQTNKKESGESSSSKTKEEQQKQAELKKQQEEQAKKQQQEQAAAEAKKQEEAKKAAEAAAAQAAAQQAASKPNHVASTGPVDTAAYTVAFGGLGYGLAMFVQSRREARE